MLNTIYDNGGMKLIKLAENGNKTFFLRLNDGMPIEAVEVTYEDDNKLHWWHGHYGRPAKFSTTEQYMESLAAMASDFVKTDEEKRAEDEKEARQEMAKRIDWVRLAHETMKSMNNEEAYYSWIYTVPDEPWMDDFEDIAEDISEFEHVKKRFYDLYEEYGKDGLYKPHIEVIAFMDREGLPYEICG